MAKVITKPVAREKPAKTAVVSSAPGTRASESPCLTAEANLATVSRKSAYATLVTRLAKDLGVKVAEVPAASPANPYRASAAVTKKALQGAGVLTRSGNLSPRLK